MYQLVRIALPVTLQCLLQSSFSVVDQIMTGQLGSISIVGIRLGENLHPFIRW
jgi:Na+-driven multidrug efflux pump